MKRITPSMMRSSLIEIFPNLKNLPLNQSRKEATKVIKLLSAPFTNEDYLHKQVDSRLEVAWDVLFDGHSSVEHIDSITSVRDTHTYNKGFLDILLILLTTPDPYDMTIIYHTTYQQFYLGTLGDAIEKFNVCNPTAPCECKKNRRKL